MKPQKLHSDTEQFRLPFVSDLQAFRGLVEKIRKFEGAIVNFQPSYGGYPKSLDLGYLAVHYSGGVAWSRHSATGGMSVARNRRTAESYQNNAVARIWHNPGYIGDVRPPKSRILSFVNPSDMQHVIDPFHPNNEGSDREKIITSVKLENFDPSTRLLIRDIFGEEGNPQYVAQERNFISE